MTPSENITNRITELGDWRGEMLSHIRKLIHEACPDVIEEWKWRGVPVWEHKGIICTGETYKAVVKLTFAKGAALEDSKKLFNSSLEGNIRRAIDIKEGTKIDKAAIHRIDQICRRRKCQTEKEITASSPPIPAIIFLL